MSDLAEDMLVNFDQLLRMPQKPAEAKILYSHIHIHSPVTFEAVKIILRWEYKDPQKHRNLESLEKHRPATYIITDILMLKNYKIYFTDTSSILYNFIQKYHKEAEV